MKTETAIVRIRKDESTHGKAPEERSIKEMLHFGFININKPSGPSSHQVSDMVKKILCLEKAGHSGTLDPGVTGCLPVALEKASRMNQFMLKAGKEYVCLIRFHNPKLDKDKAVQILKGFEGTISQKPPVRSAVKRVERERDVYYVEILESEMPLILFKIGCQAGTYIRKICSDAGKSVGGAHMQQLIRTKAGPFDVSTMVSLIDLQDAYAYYKEEGNEQPLRTLIHPPEEAVSHLKKVWATDRAIGNIAFGADLYSAGVCKAHKGIATHEIVAIFSLKNEIAAIGESEMTTQEMQNLKKGVAVKTHKVFVEPGVYPK